MSVPEPPPGPPTAPLGPPTAPLPAVPPTEPLASVPAREPRAPLAGTAEPYPPGGGPPPPGGYPPDGPYPPERSLWWQHELAIIAVGLLMLLLGGFLGYLIGHSKARVRTVASTPGGQTHTVVVEHSTSTVTSPNTASANAGSTTSPANTVVRTRTVTVPRTRTVTVPARTVTVRQAPKTVHLTTTRTITRTSTSISTTTASSSQAPSTAPQSFNGSGAETLGTIHVTSAATLKWSCPGCSSGTFAVTNSSNDPSQLSVQAQNTSSGQAPVAAGTYTGVSVQANGSWSFTITSP